MITTLQHGAIRELRLHRPPVNALSPELILGLTQAIKAAPNDGARAIVLSGAPGHFSGGLDLPVLMSLDPTGMTALLRGLYDLFAAIAGSPIPMVAAITGHAPAGGTVLPLFCDWRVGAEGDWKLGLNEVAVGLTLPPVIHHALKLVVGARQAERLAVTAVLISPAEAAQIGLVDELVPADQVVRRALDRCRMFLNLPAQAMSDTRKQARAELTALFAQSLDPEIEELMRMWWRTETQSALRTVLQQLEKRKQSSVGT
jgi:enoyl-CoA hydratase/carnithine racemase